MLPDYKNGLLFTPLRQRHLHLVMIQATFASGVATLDTANSSPGVTIAAAGSGVYNLTFPKGQTLHALAPTLDPNTSAPAANVATYAFPRLMLPLLGTGAVVFSASDGVETNPADGSRCYIALLLGKI